MRRCGKTVSIWMRPACLTVHPCRRMYEITSYEDPFGRCFPIDKSPPRAEWRADNEEAPQEARLTVDGHPLVYLMVGAIQQATVAIHPRELSHRLRVQLALLRDSDKRAAAALINEGNTHGKVAETGMSVVSVSTRADKGRGIPVSDPPPDGDERRSANLE